MTDYEKFMCKVHHLDFMKMMWRKKGDPLKVGLHTKAICERIDKAVADFDEGKSTYLIITVPFRHGKSDIISRYEPPHFIATHPDCDVMIVTYASHLADGFGRFGRDLVMTSDFQEVMNKHISPTHSSAESWGIEGGQGVVTCSGLSSGITGKGYHLGILDDYCSGRGEAESQVMRDKMWESFTNDFFTRKAPVSITIILATPWHTDDIIGRIKQYTDPNNEKYDPAFQKFEIISFPAKNGDAVVKNNKGELEKIHYDYLFTEKTLSTGEKIDGRFTKDWYDSEFAVLGEYSAQALLQCDPQMRGGNMLEMSKINFHHDLHDFPPIRYIRVWDFAHSEKQRMKDDPDWTSGTLLGYQKVGQIYHLWIKDVARIRAKAPERDNFVRAVTQKDGQGVNVFIENSVDSKDAVSALQVALRGRRIVHPVNCKGDKVTRMSYVEPIFEAGNVHIMEGEWNADWLAELRSFPSGKHDDQVDNISAGYEVLCNGKSTVGVVRLAGV